MNQYSSVLWLVVCLVVLFVSGLTNYVFSRRAKRLYAAMEKLDKKNSDEIQKIIERELRPKIHMVTDESKVAEFTARILKDISEKKSEISNSIDIYGAASLITSEVENSSLGSIKYVSEQQGPPPRAIYRDAIDHALKSKVKITRYISLFKTEEFEKRNVKKQKDYLDWLGIQIELIELYRNYKLVDVIRAPQWGTNMARIITHSSIIEITGNGDAAIFITDSIFSEQIRAHAESNVMPLNPVNLPVFHGGDGGEGSSNLCEYRDSLIPMLKKDDVQ